MFNVYIVCNYSVIHVGTFSRAIAEIVAANHTAIGEQVKMVRR
jgi:hypothetical protein